MGSILIAGGGIAGLTFAVAACRRGLDIRLVERLNSVTLGAAGIGLHPNAQRALEGIGLGRSIADVSVDLDGYYVRRPTGEEVLAQSYTATWGSPTWSVHRADLSAVLQSAVPPDCIKLGISVVGIERKNGRVTANFSDGSTNEFDLVVGADGVRSIVRRATIGEGHIEYAGVCFWRTTLPARIVDRATGSRAGEISLGLIPLVRDRTHFAAQVRSPAPVEESATTRRRDLIERFSVLGPLAQTALDLLPDNEEEIHFSRIEWVRPPAWGADRTILIGDAAHAMAPTLALGGGMAIEDAVVLADELAAHRDLDVALASFKARRTPRVAFVQERTRIALERFSGRVVDGEPPDPIEFDRRHYLPLLQAP